MKDEKIHRLYTLGSGEQIDYKECVILGTSRQSAVTMRDIGVLKSSCLKTTSTGRRTTMTLKAKTKRNELPYSYRRKGRCFGRYIIAPRAHTTYMMMRRKHAQGRFYGSRFRTRREMVTRRKMFALYYSVSHITLASRNEK